MVQNARNNCLLTHDNRILSLFLLGAITMKHDNETRNNRGMSVNADIQRFCYGVDTVEMSTMEWYL